MTDTANEKPTYKYLPYGEQQGSFHGVVACSNRDDGFFSGENNYVQHIIYTGFRYQCVEYARRFLLLTTGYVFGNCGRASEIFKMDHITHVETGETHPLIAHVNGESTQKPQPGDILIHPFDTELTPWGHVGIISYVDDHRIGVAEQNQYFGSFISPDPNYLDGERCVARFIEMTHDAEKGTWELVECPTMPRPLGWMSYNGLPQRPLIYDTFTPTESMKAARTSALDAANHPILSIFTPPTPVATAVGALKHFIAPRRGAGEASVGAGTAMARILRFTLQTLFRRDHIGSGMLSLPRNPLEATELTTLTDPAMVDVMSTLEAMGTDVHNERELHPALARYFGVPEALIAQMCWEFQHGEFYMGASLLFAPNTNATSEESQAVEKANRAAETEYVRSVPFMGPHDEAWRVAKFNMGTPRVMAELRHLQDVMESVTGMMSFILPGHRAFGSLGYRMDFGNYLKAVEALRGGRTAFTIVCPSSSSSSPPASTHDGVTRELVTILQDLCERYKYPVRVVEESDLHYKDGALYVRHAASSSPPSPNTINPTGDYKANFVFAIPEWEAIMGTPSEHPALYEAAMHLSENDIVFAKPLWTYLCSGLVNANEDNAATTAATPAHRELSVKFFDISRRLYEFAQPRQGAENWDQEVSEFKDSCRRVHIAEKVPVHPDMGVALNIVLVDHCVSAFCARQEPVLVPNPSNNGEVDGDITCGLHVFTTD